MGPEVAKTVRTAWVTASHSHYLEQLPGSFDSEYTRLRNEETIMIDKTYRFYCGIDVSKKKLDVIISSTLSVFQVSNDDEGFKELAKSLPSKQKLLVILEASGGYEKGVANYLREKNFKVAVVNAKRVRDFAKAQGKLAKTDSIDAKVIMEFGKVFNPKPQALVSDEESIRLCWLSRRDQLIKLKVLEKQYLEHSPENVRKDINMHLAYLEKKIEAIEQRLEKLVEKDPILKEKAERLEGIKGVGVVTALNVLVHLPELGSLNAKEVAALTGVAPFNKDSGKKRGKRETGGGRSVVRKALYMSILSACMYNQTIKRFYERLLSKGKLKKVAQIACVRKLVIIMNAMIRDGTKWESRMV